LLLRRRGGSGKKTKTGEIVDAIRRFSLFLGDGTLNLNAKSRSNAPFKRRKKRNAETAKTLSFAVSWFAIKRAALARGWETERRAAPIRD
jgi:hypothetical protein